VDLQVSGTSRRIARCLLNKSAPRRSASGALSFASYAIVIGPDRLGRVRLHPISTHRGPRLIAGLARALVVEPEFARSCSRASFPRTREFDKPRIVIRRVSVLEFLANVAFGGTTMKKFRALSALVVFAASTALAPATLARTADPDMQLMCENGEPAVLTCEYTRVNGKIVISKCTWNC